MLPNIPRLIRLPVFGVVLVFSLVVLGLDGHFVSQGNKVSSVKVLGHTYSTGLSAPDFAKLGVATSVLTIVSLIPMSLIEIVRKGAATSFIVVELGWLGFLWILWLATAAKTADLGIGDCSDASDACSQFHAAEAFSFLTWLLLMGYWVVLLVFAIMAVNNGQGRIWFTTVSDADFGAGGFPQGGGVPQGGATYPPQQQQFAQPQQQAPPMTA